MISDAELEALAAAWERGDGAALATGGAALGVALDLARLTRLEPRLRNRLGRRDVLLTVAAALDAEHGLGLREINNVRGSYSDGKDYCLAVKRAHAITVGVRHARNLPMTPSHVWGTLRPWYRELGRNRARCEAWATEEDADRITLALVERPASLRGAAPDVATLRAEIVAHPDDDRPRLVLADALTEAGDAHGELITLQLRLATLPPAYTDRDNPTTADERAKLHERVKALLAAHGARIAGEVAERATAYDIRRGFVDAVTMAAPTFARHGERLFGAHPITSLTLKPLNPTSLTKLAASPSLARVRRLRLEQEIGAEREVPLEPLGRSPYLASLTELELDNYRTTDDDWESALAALDAPRLTAVRIVSEGGPRGVIGLARNPRLSSLRELRFRPGWGFSAADPNEIGRMLAALAQSSLAALEILELEDVRPLWAEQLTQLLDKKAPFRLRHLGLDGCDLADGAAEAIAASPGASELRIVEVSRAEMTAAGYAALLRLPRLERLQSYANDLPPEQAPFVVQALRDLPGTHPLRMVAISGVILPPELAERFTSPD